MALNALPPLAYSQRQDARSPGTTSAAALVATSTTISTRTNEKTDAPTPERKSTRQVSGTSISIHRRFRDRSWPRYPATVAVDGEQPIDKRHRVPRFPRLGWNAMLIRPRRATGIGPPQAPETP